MRNIACFACLLLLLGACGKAAPEAAAPQAPAEAAPTSLAGSAQEQEQEPATLAEAEALLDRARADLDQLALNEPGSAGPVTAGAPAPAPAPAPPPAAAPRSEEKRSADKADESAAAAPKKEANTCQTACKAFSSLERASDAVCRLDTEGGGRRCERAKQIREDAARRISSCSCK
jgi:hypothetical protein